jgi:chromate reductase, NAD(P)H dehydrogenase (quinone)
MSQGERIGACGSPTRRDFGTTTLLLISGSRRRESFNTRLLRDLGSRLTGQCRADFLEPGQVDLPLFDQDLESDAAVLKRVAALHRRFEACNGFVVASPEYNGQLPAYLKNLIDWISRLAHIDARFDNPFRDRPVLLCGASTGSSGAALAVPHARALFGYVGCLVMDVTVCVAHADQAWSGEGYVFDPFFDAEVDAALEGIVRLADAPSAIRARHAATA